MQSRLELRGRRVYKTQKALVASLTFAEYKFFFKENWLVRIVKLRHYLRLASHEFTLSQLRLTTQWKEMKILNGLLPNVEISA